MECTSALFLAMQRAGDSPSFRYRSHSVIARSSTSSTNRLRHAVSDGSTSPVSIPACCAAAAICSGVIGQPPANLVLDFAPLETAGIAHRPAHVAGIDRHVGLGLDMRHDIGNLHPGPATRLEELAHHRHVGGSLGGLA